MNKILGKLVAQKDCPEILVGQVDIQSYSISVEIDPDDCSVESATSLAEKIVTSLKQYDQIARNIINRDLLETYNSDGTEKSQTGCDESGENIQNSKLSPDEFQKLFTLKSVGICGDNCVDILYDTDNLFSGHSVYVTSFEGVDFSGASAQLFDLESDV